jgi:hypothetical protein
VVHWFIGEKFITGKAVIELAKLKTTLYLPAPSRYTTNELMNQ